MTGNGADEIDGIEDDARIPVVHNSDTVNIAALTIRRGRRKHANQLGRKWPNPLLPPRWQFTGPIVFLTQARRKIAGAVVIALNSVVVLAPEVTRIAAALVIVLLIVLVLLAFALTLTVVVVFGKEVNGRQRTEPEQGSKELSPIHVSISSNQWYSTIFGGAGGAS
jgi:hypothetical protein